MTASSPMAVARIAAGLTQAQLAARIGLSQGQLSRIEHGTNEPAVSVALAIAEELGVAIGALWARARPRPAPQHRPLEGAATRRKAQAGSATRPRKR